jgi:hypothetical protein
MIPLCIFTTEIHRRQDNEYSLALGRNMRFAFRQFGVQIVVDRYSFFYYYTRISYGKTSRACTVDMKMKRKEFMLDKNTWTTMQHRQPCAVGFHAITPGTTSSTSEFDCP